MQGGGQSAGVGRDEADAASAASFDDMVEHQKEIEAKRRATAEFNAKNLKEQAPETVIANLAKRGIALDNEAVRTLIVEQAKSMASDQRSIWLVHYFKKGLSADPAVAALWGDGDFSYDDSIMIMLYAIGFEVESERLQAIIEKLTVKAEAWSLRHLSSCEYPGEIRVFLDPLAFFERYRLPPSRFVSHLLPRALLSGTAYVDRLLEAVESHGVTRLMLAVSQKDKLDAGDFEGVDINARDQWGLTALHYAAWRVRVDPSAVQQLLEHGADPTIADCHGRTPLMGTDLLRLQYLVGSEKIDLNQVDEDGRPAYFYSATPSVADYFWHDLRSRINLEHTDVDGNNFLMRFLSLYDDRAFPGDISSIAPQPGAYMTPCASSLAQAIRRRNKKAFKQFLAFTDDISVDEDRLNFWHSGLLEFAVEGNRAHFNVDAIVQKLPLREAEALMRRQDDLGRTYFHIAAMNGRAGVMGMLRCGLALAVDADAAVVEPSDVSVVSDSSDDSMPEMVVELLKLEDRAGLNCADRLLQSAAEMIEEWRLMRGGELKARVYDQLKVLFAELTSLLAVVPLHCYPGRFSPWALALLTRYESVIDAVAENLKRSGQLVAAYQCRNAEGRLPGAYISVKSAMRKGAFLRHQPDDLGEDLLARQQAAAMEGGIVYGRGFTAEELADVGNVCDGAADKTVHKGDVDDERSHQFGSVWSNRDGKIAEGVSTMPAAAGVASDSDEEAKEAEGAAADAVGHGQWGCVFYNSEALKPRVDRVAADATGVARSVGS